MTALVDLQSTIGEWVPYLILKENMRAKAGKVGVRLQGICFSSGISDIYLQQFNNKLILLSLCPRSNISDRILHLSQLMCSTTVE
jgi:hypothetical protein